MDAERPNVRMMEQLGCPKEEGEEMIVIQTPDAVGSSRLKVVGALKLMEEGQVSRENEQSDGGKHGLWEEGESIQAEQPYDEVQLMTGTVIYTSAIAKGIVKISRHFRDRGRRG